MPKFHKWLKRIQASLSKSNSRSRHQRSSTSSAHTDSSTSSSATNKSSPDESCQSLSSSSSHSRAPNVRELEPSKVLYEFDQLELTQWENAVVVVVGASGEIGTSLVIKLVRCGFTVIGCSKTDELINALAEECKERNFKGQLFSHKCSLMTERDVKDLFAMVHKKFGRIDILINNPDLVNDPGFKRYSEDALRDMVQRKILILILCTKEAARYMMKQEGSRGVIFNICSTVDLIAVEYGKMVDSSSSSSSSSSQTSRPLSAGLKLHEIEQSNIQVTAISPGKSQADLFRRIYGTKYLKATRALPASESYYSAQDVANTLLFSLCSLSAA